MQYPKKVMKLTELVKEMGFPEEYLQRAYRLPTQRFAGKMKNYDGQTGMELSYVAVQATRPKKKTVDWVGITETFIAGGMWVIVFMMLGAALAVQVL